MHRNLLASLLALVVVLFASASAFAKSTWSQPCPFGCSIPTITTGAACPVGQPCPVRPAVPMTVKTTCPVLVAPVAQPCPCPVCPGGQPCPKTCPCPQCSTCMPVKPCPCPVQPCVTPCPTTCPTPCPCPVPKVSVYPICPEYRVVTGTAAPIYYNVIPYNNSCCPVR